MIRVENLHKSYGGNVIFDNISFKINTRERVGLVGRNGHGKTTLLRLLTGSESPDDGMIVVPKSYRIGYVQQHIEFKKDTVLDECMTGLPETEKDHFWKAEKILAGLGFSLQGMQQQPALFSGGFQVRLNLAKVLVSEPDLLLLDEPTNYLDITSIRWIRRFLSSWPHELILITHDRGFMDGIITHTLGIHRKNVRKITGNTEKYYSQIAQDEEIFEKTRLNDERRQKEIEVFISRFRAKARLANMVQSRIKTLSKMDKQQKLEKIKTLDFSFQYKPFKSKTMMQVENLGFGYHEDTLLFSNLDITVHPGDRICIVGKNGKGKTTLLKVLGESLQPVSGKIQYTPGVEKAMFEQTNINHLDDSKSVEEEILYAHPGVDRQIARNICGAMMFSGDDALKKISVLSGGEKSRVMLGKLLVTPANLLLLDEPTNHLDMDSCDALLAAIDSFEGTVMMVTHNEMFLHALAKKLIIFKDEQISVFQGTYQSFLEKGGWQDDNDIQPDASPVKSFDKKDRKLLKRERSELIARRGKTLGPLQKKSEQVERKIETLENDLERFNHAMQDATLEGDGSRISALSQSIHQCRTEIDTLFDDLEKLTNVIEKEKSEFDRKIALLDHTEG